MAILIDIQPVKSLISQPSTYSNFAENPGFRLYWRSMGRDPVQVAEGLAMTDTLNRAAALDQAGLENKSVLNSLGRISGVSIEQQVLRHLPGDPFIDAQVVFVPGGDLVLAAEGNIVAINVFSLEQRVNKLFLGDFPLLSLIANRVHRLCSNPGSVQLANSRASAVNSFLYSLLREGCATLFFTMPVTGPVYQLWQDAEGKRDSQLDLFRQYLRVKEGEVSSLALARELEQAFALTGKAALAARFPLGTWMCQVIESAFGRSRLVELLQQPGDFLRIFEQARNQFGLAEKYCLEVL